MNEQTAAVWRELVRASILSEMSIGWEDFLSAGGKTHTKKQCKATRKAGGPVHCAVHRPSEHHMRSWPMLLRSSTLLERLCPHGVGHPDPDSAAYLDWRDGIDSWGLHGCDGCCSVILL